MYAIIQNNTVTDNLQVDPASIYPDAYAARFVPVPAGVRVGWVRSGADFVPPAPPTLAERQAAAWERIKQERDRRKYLGVKVGDHWFHSDDPSRIQQISLFIMVSAVPPIPWKTLTLTPPPVFVPMSQALAAGIFQNTAASDAAIFAAAEVHRVAMEASAAPQDYDCSTGWPASIEDAP